MDFVAAVVVDERAPVGMSPLAGIGVLIEVRAVELREAVSIAREMRGSPVQEDTDPSLMTAIDEFHEFGGRAVATGGGEVTESLIAPGAIIGMLHDGKQFDVGVAEFFDVRDELGAEFAVREPAVRIFRATPPGPEMNFVDGNGRFEPIFL